jgi:uncharacterized membrane protein
MPPTSIAILGAIVVSAFIALFRYKGSPAITFALRAAVGAAVLIVAPMLMPTHQTSYMMLLALPALLAGAYIMAFVFWILFCRN